MSVFDAEYIRSPPESLVVKRKNKAWRAYTRLNNYLFRWVDKPTESRISTGNLIGGVALEMETVTRRRDSLIDHRAKEREEDSRIYDRNGQVREELNNNFVKRMLRAKRPKPLHRAKTTPVSTATGRTWPEIMRSRRQFTF